jgi:hypothetical protein
LRLRAGTLATDLPLIMMEKHMQAARGRRETLTEELMRNSFAGAGGALDEVRMASRFDAVLPLRSGDGHGNWGRWVEKIDEIKWDESIEGDAREAVATLDRILYFGIAHALSEAGRAASHTNLEDWSELTL